VVEREGEVVVISVERQYQNDIDALQRDLDEVTAERDLLRESIAVLETSEGFFNATIQAAQALVHAECSGECPEEYEHKFNCPHAVALMRLTDAVAKMEAP